MTILVSTVLAFVLAFALSLGLSARGVPFALVLVACFVLGVLIALIVSAAL